MLEASSLSFRCLTMTCVYLLSVLSFLLGPEDTGFKRSLNRRRRRKREEGKQIRWEDSKALGWYGNQVLEKKKRNAENQMGSAVDMTASSLESADLLLVQLHGRICIYMIPQNADMCGDLSVAICECLCTVCFFSVRLCAWKHIWNISWADRRSLLRL